MKLIYLLLSFLFILGSCNKKQEKKLVKTANLDLLVDAEPEPEEELGYTVTEEGDGDAASLKEKVLFTPPDIGGTYVQTFSNGSSEPSTNKPVNKKMIIKDGTISFKTTNLAKAKTQLDSVIKRFGAYYDKEEFSNDDNQSSFNLSIRIPSVYFESFLTQIERSELELLTKSITARDVTTEFIDTETRLNNKKAYLKKYNELLVRANSIKDILQLQENIRALQEEIESSEGQLKYLLDQVGYSTLNLELIYKKDYVYKPQNQDSFFELIKRSLTGGWQSVKNLALFLIQSWPYLVLAAILFTWFKIRKKKKSQA